MEMRKNLKSVWGRKKPWCNQGNTIAFAQLAVW